MKFQPFVIIFLFIAAIGVVIWYCTKKPLVKVSPAPENTGVVELFQLNASYEKRLDSFSEVTERLQDSLMHYKVEKGQIEISLNRSEEKLRTFLRWYNVAKTKSDVEQMLINCDSLANEMDHEYISQQIRYRYMVDSVTDFYEAVISTKDAEGLVKSTTIDTLNRRWENCLNDKADIQHRYNEQKAKNEKQKKKNLLRIAGGAVVGAVITLFGIL